MKKLQRILVPINFSETSYNALYYAEHVARTTGCTLYVLHVIEKGVKTPFNAAREIENVLQYINAKRLKARLAVKHGAVRDEIIRFARQHNVDSIIMGTKEFGLHEDTMIMSLPGYVAWSEQMPVVFVGKQHQNRQTETDYLYVRHESTDYRATKTF